MATAVQVGTRLSDAQRDLLRIVGYSCQRGGRAAQAAAIFAALHALDPQDEFAAKSLAHAHLCNDRPELALELLNRLLDAGDNGALTHLLRGQALARLGRFAEAARAMRLYIGARAPNVLEDR